jgi:hypothetical protein
MVHFVFQFFGFSFYFLKESLCYFITTDTKRMCLHNPTTLIFRGACMELRGEEFLPRCVRQELSRNIVKIRQIRKTRPNSSRAGKQSQYFEKEKRCCQIMIETLGGMTLEIKVSEYNKMLVAKLAFQINWSRFSPYSRIHFPSIVNHVFRSG